MQDCFESTDWEVFEHEDLSSTNGAVGDSTRQHIQWTPGWSLVSELVPYCCLLVHVLLCTLSALRGEPNRLRAMLGFK